MGTSTDGILAYGYALGSPRNDTVAQFVGYEEYEGPTWLDDTDDYDHDPFTLRLLRQSGFTEQYKDGRAGYHGRLRDAEKALGVEIKTYCSCDYPMYLLAAAGCVFTARRGAAVPIDFTVPEGADARLAWAVEQLELNVEGQSPRWLLASNWC